MKLTIQFTGSPSPTLLSIPDDEMRSVIRQALTDPEFRKMLDDELEKEKLPHGADLYDAFTNLIHIKGNGTRLGAEGFVDLSWTFISDDGDCWILPLTELILDEKKKDIVFVFENREARFEEGLNEMDKEMFDAVIEEFHDWL